MSWAEYESQRFVRVEKIFHWTLPSYFRLWFGKWLTVFCLDLNMPCIVRWFNANCVGKADSAQLDDVGAYLDDSRLFFH